VRPRSADEIARSCATTAPKIGFRLLVGFHRSRETFEPSQRRQFFAAKLNPVAAAGGLGPIE